MRSLKRWTLSLAAFSLLTFAAFPSYAHGQGRGETKAKIGAANVSIEYGRPALKGRDMLKMMPVGSVWRIGSDASTTLTTDADLDFGGTRVPKGSHILLTRLAEPGKWSLIVSSKAAFQYEPSAKLAEVPLDIAEGQEALEELTLTLSHQGGRGVLEIAWGKARLTGTFTPAK